MYDFARKKLKLEMITVHTHRDRHLLHIYDWNRIAYLEMLDIVGVLVIDLAPIEDELSLSHGHIDTDTLGARTLGGSLVSHGQTAHEPSSVGSRVSGICFEPSLKIKLTFVVKQLCSIIEMFSKLLIARLHQF